MADSTWLVDPVNGRNVKLVDLGDSTYAPTVTALTGGFSVSVTPTVGTAGYVAGDSIGGILSFTSASYISGRPIRIENVSIIDKSHQTLACTLQFFTSTPSGGTYTDGSALVYGSGDYAKFKGQQRILAANWLSYPATPSASFVEVASPRVVPIAATTLFALLIADASYSLTAGDVIITISGEQL